ncbi:hypothetical protein Tco_1546255 [Tanacetum coccineum]
MRVQDETNNQGASKLSGESLRDVDYILYLEHNDIVTYLDHGREYLRDKCPWRVSDTTDVAEHHIQDLQNDRLAMNIEAPPVTRQTWQPLLWSSVLYSVDPEHSEPQPCRLELWLGS